MVLKSQQYVQIRKTELKSKERVKNVLQPLVEHIGISINGSLTCKDVYQTVISMAIDKNSIHPASKKYHKVPCETSIRHHPKKLEMDKLLEPNEKILMQMAIENLKTGKNMKSPLITPMIHTMGKQTLRMKKYIVHEQAKKSTNSFYSCVSIYTINKNERFTILVIPVEKSKSNIEYLEYFIDLILESKFSVWTESFIQPMCLIFCKNRMFHI